ncbi:hypothetical protein K491DRAFT_784643 [Lophiostoma macrostomum CBS 122681]|uniref:Uncharacterized protein n=1 Tax=Lophiostoma macrostomum CBS 122681 TaxID=1314788 RepID=A0A6A6SMJ1_9PLEO|nr:hypothetical protein K491DRAFT_784643 [Lophiostoma macrostomum CBS 122681]
MSSIQNSYEYITGVIEHIFQEKFEAAGDNSQKLQRFHIIHNEQGGLAYVHAQDFLATQSRIKDPYFQKTEIPRLAATFAKTHYESFKHILKDPSPASGKTLWIPDWIPNLMRMKCDLLISAELHNIVYIPPGARYDPECMIVETPAGAKVGDASLEGKPSDYAVKLCQWPALTATPDRKFAEEFDVEANYKEALLAERTFFSEPEDWQELLEK